MNNESFIRPNFSPARSESCFCGSGARFKNCCGSTRPDRPPPHGMHVVPGYVDADTCRQWTQYLESQDRRQLGVYEFDEEGELRSTTVAKRITDEVKANRHRVAINDCVAHAYRTLIGRRTGRSFAWFEKPQVLRYEPGGWYNVHADSENMAPGGDHWIKTIDRDYSLLIYLNDDMEGGDLELVNFGYTHRPRAGDLVYFPSDNRYSHQALPVLSGVKWAVVSWAAFSDEPKVSAEPPRNCVLMD